MKDIPGFEGLYEVDEYGNVYGKPKRVKHRNIMMYISRRVCRQHPNKKGYPTVYIYKSSKKYTFRTHRLVAICFIPNPNNLPQINHKDGNKLNNHVSNLEWCTNLENMRHSHYVLGRKKLRGDRNKMARPLIQLTTGIYFETMKDARSALSLCQGALRKSIHEGTHSLAFC